MSTEFPDWLNDFITASFGEYQLMNQHQLVQQQLDSQSLNQQNELNKNMLNQEDQANVKGINDQTGEVFEVVVKDIDKKKKDKGLQIEFVGGRHGERYICSSIEDFCNGRYTHLVSQPLQVVAEEIAKDNSFINNFIDISIAGNSESINIETALDITNKITKESYISDSDYKKICAKLNYEDLNSYNVYLKSANIKIAATQSQIKYYVDYIKNFKEYKLSSQDPKKIESLKSRIASVEKFKKIAKELSEEFKKDPILQNINIGE